MRNRLVSIKRIIENEVGERIDTKNRKRMVTYARAVFCQLGRDLGFSYDAIGSVINKDHATVMHNVKNIFPFSQKEYYYRNLYETAKHLKYFKEDREAQAEVKQEFNALMELSKKIDELQKERDALSFKLMLLQKDESKLTSLFDGLQEHEIEEVYNKMTIFVKAIKSRVYL